jgi:hypothetical protein
MSIQGSGKTIWELFCDRLKGEPSVSVYNPLEQVTGVSYPLRTLRYDGYDFTISEIREYTRKIRGQSFVFSDYVLVGTKNFDNRTRVTLRLRIMPNEAGGKDAILLRLYDDLEYSRELDDVVRDATGEFHVTYDEGELDGHGQKREEGDTEVYFRLNGNRSSFEAKVLVVRELDSKKKAIVKSSKAAELEYWDYCRETEGGAPCFLFVEMDRESGWFQIWQGETYYL